MNIEIASSSFVNSFFLIVTLVDMFQLRSQLSTLISDQEGFCSSWFQSRWNLDYDISTEFDSSQIEFYLQCLYQSAEPTIPQENLR